MRTSVRNSTNLLAKMLFSIIVLSVASSTHAGLVAYYNFDDGQTVTDQVGDNHGTLIHNAGFSVDTPDGSPFSLDLTADGVGPDQDYVRIGPAAEGFGDPEGRDFGIAETNSFSIAAWVNYTQSERGIVTIKQDLTSAGGDRSGVTFGIDGQDRLFFGIIVSTEDEFLDESNSGGTFRDITTDEFVPTGEWVHIAGTYDFDSDTLVGYINGDAMESYGVNPAGVINDDGTDITLGAGIDFFDNDGSFTGLGAAGNGPLNADSAGDFTRLFYDGLLDDVAIWNEALTAAQIESLANRTRTPPQILGGKPGDFNFDGIVDAADIDLLTVGMISNDAAFDLDGDRDADFDDRLVLVKDIIGTWIGDANLDGEFNSTDLVVIFSADQFDQEVSAKWGTGDFNGDGMFSSGDFVVAFTDGGYELGPLPASASVPEPTSLGMIFVFVVFVYRAKR